MKFQIHQESEHEFHLRLKLREGRLEELIHYFKDAWNHSINSEDMILVITRVDDLKSAPNGKFHDFTSVFQP